MVDDPRTNEKENMEGEKCFKIDREQVKRSVEALWLYVQKSQGLNSAALLDFAEQVSLQLGFTKVPHLKNNKTIKVRLENTLLQENQDVCLFVKDVDPRNRDYSKTVESCQEKLDEADVTCVTKIIPIKSLKTEYKPFEAKRNLSDMFEFFLADERICAFLPRLLGKHFLSKKRHPVPVNLKAKQLKKELDQAMNTSLCIITGRGASCQMKVAHTAMTIEDAVENVIKAAETLAEKIPGGPTNVKTLHIRTFDSPAIPVYVSQVNPNDVPTPVQKLKREPMELSDVTTITGAQVMVKQNGMVHVIPEGEALRHMRKRLRNQDGTKTDAAPPAKNANGTKTKAVKKSKVTPGKNKNSVVAKKVDINAKKVQRSRAKKTNGNKTSDLKGKPPKIRKIK